MRGDVLVNTTSVGMHPQASLGRDEHHTLVPQLHANVQQLVKGTLHQNERRSLA